MVSKPSRRFGLSSFLNRAWTPFLLVCVTALMAHGLSLRADFYMDDGPHIETNPRVQSGMDWPTGFKSRHLTYGLWRGIHLTFGDRSWAYHAVNLLFHVATATMFLAVARAFLALNQSERWSSEDRSRIAFWGAVLFACHPLCSEPVNYAAQTSILMASFFTMLATYLFLRWHQTRRSLFLTLLPLVALLAAHAKEPGIVHVSINLFFLGALTFSPKMLRTLRENRRLRMAAIAGAGMVAIIFVGGWMMSAFGRVADHDRFFSYSLTQSRVLFGYLWRVLLPFNLSSDHFIPWSTSFRDFPAAIALVIAVLCGITTLVFAVWKRNWWGALVALALFHLFVRYAYTVDELMVEYRTYPAMPWFALLLSCGIHRLTGLSPGKPSWLRPVAFAAVAVVFTALSALRSHVWSDEYRLVQNVLRQYPENLRALSIFMSHKSEREEFQDLAAMRGLPEQLAGALGARANANPTRQYSAENIYLNFLSCQYFVILGLVKTGETEEALRRCDVLLVDVLRKAPSKNHKSLFTIVLAKLLCHQAMGQPEKIEETIHAIRSHYDQEDRLRFYLKAETEALALNTPP